MKLLHTSIFKVVTVVSLVLLLLTPSIASAQTNSSVDEDRVKELAEALEFVYEEAVIYDKEGNVIGINGKKIEEKYGSKASMKLDDIQKNTTKCNMVSTLGILDDNSYIACVQDKLGDYLGSFLPGTFIASLLDEFSDGKYMDAAKRIIKAGFKGSALAIAAELAVIEVTCLWQHDNYA